MPKQKNPQTSLSPKAYSKLNKNQIILLVVVALLAILFYFKSLFIAATVNGTPITRLAVIQRLEKTAGKQTLGSLITKELLLQEASKRKITISDQEVNKEISKIQANIKKQGGTLEQALTAQGMSQSDLRDQVKLQKILEKMFADQLKVTEKEIDQFIEANKNNIPQATDPAVIRESVKQQLQQNKLGPKVQELINNLKKSAQINYFVNY